MSDLVNVWVSVIRVCESLGIASNPQLAKLHGKAWASGTIIVPQAKNKLSRETFFMGVN